MKQAQVPSMSALSFKLTSVPSLPGVVPSAVSAIVVGHAHCSLVPIGCFDDGINEVSIANLLLEEGVSVASALKWIS